MIIGCVNNSETPKTFVQWIDLRVSENFHIPIEIENVLCFELSKRFDKYVEWMSMWYKWHPSLSADHSKLTESKRLHKYFIQTLAGVESNGTRYTVKRARYEHKIYTPYTTEEQCVLCSTNGPTNRRTKQQQHLIRNWKQNAC